MFTEDQLEPLAIQWFQDTGWSYEDAIALVLQQAEALADEWTAGG